MTEEREQHNKMHVKNERHHKKVQKVKYGSNRSKCINDAGGILFGKTCETKRNKTLARLSENCSTFNTTSHKRKRKCEFVDAHCKVNYLTTKKTWQERLSKLHGKINSDSNTSLDACIGKSADRNFKDVESVAKESANINSHVSLNVKSHKEKGKNKKGSMTLVSEHKSKCRDFSRKETVMKDVLKTACTDSNISDSNICGNSLQNILADSDSDEDLPEGLVSKKVVRRLRENDVAWVNHTWQKKWQYLPVLVTEVNRKTKKLTCQLFSPPGYDKKILTVSYRNPKIVLPFSELTKEDILKEDCSLKDKSFFEKCYSQMENYLTEDVRKKRESHMTGKDDMLMDMNKDNIHNDKTTEHQTNIDNHKTLTDTVTEKPSTEPVSAESTHLHVNGVPVTGMSKKGLIRRRKMVDKTKPLTEFLVSKKCKTYLKKILDGTIKSTCDDIFWNGTSTQKKKMRHHGFGPLDDDAQIDHVLTTYIQWFNEIRDSRLSDTHAVNYAFDVWLPEGIVYALKVMKGYSTKKAWSMFDKGVKRTKEELSLLRTSMVGCSNKKMRKIPKPLVLVDATGFVQRSAAFHC